VLISSLGFISNFHSQEFNRAYFNLNVGYKRHNEVGFVVHVFNHFASAFYHGNSSIPTGYFYNTEAFLFKEQIKNRYSFTTFFLGFKTHTNSIIDFSLMGSFSGVQYTEYYNFQPDPDNSHYVTYQRKEGKSFGGAIRGDMIISAGEFFGFNLSVQYNMNPVLNDFNVLVGISFGLVADRTNM